VFLTEAGRNFRQSAVAGLAPDMTAIAAAFSVDRVAEALPALADLRKIMDAMRDADPGAQEF
jgi:hypothetical protein